MTSREENVRCVPAFLFYMRVITFMSTVDLMCQGSRRIGEKMAVKGWQPTAPAAATDNKRSAPSTSAAAESFSPFLNWREKHFHISFHPSSVISLISLSLFLFSSSPSAFSPPSLSAARNTSISRKDGRIVTPVGWNPTYTRLIAQ